MARAIESATATWRQALYHLGAMKREKSEGASPGSSPRSGAIPPSQPQSAGHDPTPESTRVAESLSEEELEQMEGWHKVDTLSETMAQDMLSEAMGGSRFDEHAVDHARRAHRDTESEPAPPPNFDETELDELEGDTLDDSDARRG